MTFWKRLIGRDRRLMVTKGSGEDVGLKRWSTGDFRVGRLFCMMLSWSLHDTVHLSKSKTRYSTNIEAQCMYVLKNPF